MRPTYEGQDRRAPEAESWHLKKEINLSMIISIIGIAVACVIGYSDLKRDIAVLQLDVATLHTRNNKAETDLRDAITLIRSQFERLDAKLDRIIEREKKK